MTTYGAGVGAGRHLVIESGAGRLLSGQQRLGEGDTSPVYWRWGSSEQARDILPGPCVNKSKHPFEGVTGLKR